MLGAQQISDSLRTVFFLRKKRRTKKKLYRTEVIFEDKNFQFLSSKITSVLKKSFQRAHFERSEKQSY